MWTVDGKEGEKVNIIPRRGVKRKHRSQRPSRSVVQQEIRKRIFSDSECNEQWTKIDVPLKLVDLDNLDGDVISLEELEDYVVEGGKIIPMNKSSKNEKGNNSSLGTDGTIKTCSLDIIPLPRPVNLPSWKSLDLNLEILNALHDLKFTEPTEIQLQAIPVIGNRNDIVGIAETGSGKTLAYLIPIIKCLFEQKVAEEKDYSLLALVLVPTRELALQVKKHFDEVTKYINAKAAVIIGGMSIEKQLREMRTGRCIWIATPGRLSDCLTNEESLMKPLSKIRFLIFDEADKLLQPNHFEALTKVVKRIEGPLVTADVSSPVQFILMSATTDAAVSLKSQTRLGSRVDPSLFLKVLNTRFNIQRKFEILDVRNGTETARNLVHSLIECCAKDKDLYLIYILTRYPGRSLVFVNSIDGVRRLSSVLQLMRYNVFTLHSGLQQKQRLQRLERFVKEKSGILLASDVAARGLDLPRVDHVIHFQVPRSFELYVHRSGRTARQRNDGISILISSPEEMGHLAKVRSRLRDDCELHEFPIDHSILMELRERVDLAKTVDAKVHKMQKTKFDVSWMKRMADELEVDYSGDEANDEEQVGKYSQHVQSLKDQLWSLLQKPLKTKAKGTKFVATEQGRSVADHLLGTEAHDHILCVENSRAITDVRRN